jgi:hypothetical protein
MAEGGGELARELRGYRSGRVVANLLSRLSSNAPSVEPDALLLSMRSEWFFVLDDYQSGHKEALLAILGRRAERGTLESSIRLAPPSGRE